MAESQAAANPLIKTDAEDDRSALEGAGLFQDFWDAGTAVADGNWTEGLANAAFGAGGIAELVADPIGTLASAAVGWAMEFFPWLREPLDWLTGDQTALENMVGTWENVGKELEKISTDLQDTVKKDSENWTGPSADAYRAFTDDRAATYAGVATGANAISKLVEICKTILSVVRSIVRDLISECVGKLISIACRYPGPALPAGMATEGTAEAVKTGSKCMEWIKKLVKAFKKAQELFHRISGIFNRVKDVLRRGADRLPGPLRRVGGMLESKDAQSFADKVRKARPTRQKWGQVVSSEHSIGENLRDAGREFTNDARREFSEKFGEKFGEELKNATKEEAGKEVLKHLAEGLDGDDDDDVESPDEQSAARQPVFDHQGGRRISGSIE
ncbi:WXG100 family type VII secretion target [Amycolatopsis sp. NBC_00438]|uniref:WXG100 family type VII secretion target n=1 Tax=Amycolatopsis sp. NBC_00438 TaxID=2903558 RepID=UPI002E236D8C